MNTLVQNFNFVDTAAGLSNVYYVNNGGVVLITLVLYSLPILPNRVCMLGSSFDAYHFMVHATGECICAVKGRKLTCLLSMHYF